MVAPDVEQGTAKCPRLQDSVKARSAFCYECWRNRHDASQLRQVSDTCWGLRKKPGATNPLTTSLLDRIGSLSAGHQ